MNEENIVVIEPVKHYRESTMAIHNKGLRLFLNLGVLSLFHHLIMNDECTLAGESIESLEAYGESVRKLFNLNKA